MDNKASNAAVVPIQGDIVALLRRADAPVIITETFRLYADLAEKMRKQNLTYLDLPPVLAVLTLDPWYHDALCWGRGMYYDGLHEYDEALNCVVRVPDPYTREEICEHVLAFLSLEDPRLAVSVPLSWRVGVVVGWLSGLSTSQREDVQAAMVLVSSLVFPLLISHSSDGSQTAVLRLPSSARRSSQSGRKKSGRK